MSRNLSNKYLEGTRSSSPRGHRPQKDLSQACPTPPTTDLKFLKIKGKEEERVETDPSKTHSDPKVGSSPEIQVESENTVPKNIEGTPSVVRMDNSPRKGTRSRRGGVRGRKGGRGGING
jgi:hypothetical protein